MKNCIKCGVPKELQSRCKKCQLEFAKTYYKKNSNKILAHLKAQRKKDPDKARDQWMRSKYGLTFDELNRRLIAQGGACKICGDAPKRWCVDHDHKTGKVRSILCYNCNLALGHLKDSAKRAFSAAAYLIEHGNP